MAERQMWTCREITALATDYSEGHLGATDRARFETHIAGCDGCATFVRQLERTAKAVGALPEPELPMALRVELLARFDDWAGQRASSAASAKATEGVRGRFVAVSLVATLATVGLLVALGRHPSRSPADWAIALALTGVAATLAALAHRATLRHVATAVSAVLATSLLAGSRGPLEIATGLECLLTVLAAAGGVTGTAWFVLRRGPAALVRSAVGSLAVAGAMAGVAALQLTCGAHTSVAHLLVFHVGGLLAVAATVFLGPRLAARPA